MQDFSRFSSVTGVQSDLEVTSRLCDYPSPGQGNFRSPFHR